MQNIGDLRPISQFGEQYDLVQIDYDVQSTLEFIGYKSTDNDSFDHLLVLVDEAEYLEVWGIVGIPYTNKSAELIYSKRWEPIRFELSHLFYAIGELAKTKRYPKRRETFMQRVESWILQNKADMTINDTEKFGVICAYNFGWITKHAVTEFYGIDADSLWLER